MPQTDPRIDAYIQKAAPFAQPILAYLRTLVHETCPDVSETIKWGMPSFEYKGLMVGMASFKQHCAFSFWKGNIIPDPHGLLSTVGSTGMGNLGKITALTDLPNREILIYYVQEAMRLNEEGIQVPKDKTKAAKRPSETPPELLEALKENPAAQLTYDQFPPGQKRDYDEWIAEAKTDATRQKRLKEALQWLSEGKIRNWKYAKG
jgi:uncharacterized protein YdeI (YjbR/CyaY-like superfamily)